MHLWSRKPAAESVEFLLSLVEPEALLSEEQRLILDVEATPKDSSIQRVFSYDSRQLLQGCYRCPEEHWRELHLL